MSMKRAASLGLVLAVALALPAASEEPLKPVKIITAEDRGADMTRQFFGGVVARQSVDLAFQVGGQLEEFPVIEGTVVPKGELVAQLDLESFELTLNPAYSRNSEGKVACA